MRCEQHGLGCGPDGRCVLCRKSAPPEARSAGRFVLWGAIAVLTVAAAGAFALARPRATGSIEPDFHSVIEPPVAPSSSDEAVPAPVVRSDPDPLAPGAPPDPARARELAMLRAIASGATDPAVPSESASAAATAPAPSPPATAPAPQARAEAPAASLSDVRVVVYTTSWCSVCKRAKSWMSANGVAYEERDVETSDANARRMRAINPRGGVPTFDVEGQVMVGFSEDSLLATMRQAARRRSARSM